MRPHCTVVCSPPRLLRREPMGRYVGSACFRERGHWGAFRRGKHRPTKPDPAAPHPRSRALSRCLESFRAADWLTSATGRFQSQAFAAESGHWRPGRNAVAVDVGSEWWTGLRLVLYQPKKRAVRIDHVTDPESRCFYCRLTNPRPAQALLRDASCYR